MNLSELRAIVLDVQTKAHTLNATTQNLRGFIDAVETMVGESNSFAETINVDQFVAIQTPIYLELLRQIEIAADALGTDVFN